MGDDQGKQGFSQRKVKNFLLQPLLQVKLGLYSIGLAVVFSVLILGMLYLNLYRFYDMVVELTDIGSEVSGILEAYMTEASWWLVGSLVVYLTLNVIVSILYTHRLVGPTFAFRRHIRNLRKGDYSSRVTLRKRDAFGEVANELNELAQHLQQQQKK